MSVQILDSGPSSGEIAADSMGRGLDYILDALSAKSKRKKQSKGYEALGITREQAQAIVNMPPKLQEITLNGIMKQQQAVSARTGQQEASRRYLDSLMDKNPSTGNASGTLPGIGQAVEPNDPLLNQELQRSVQASGIQPQLDLQSAMQDQSFTNPGIGLLQALQGDQGVGQQQIPIQQMQALDLLRPSQQELQPVQQEAYADPAYKEDSISYEGLEGLSIDQINKEVARRENKLQQERKLVRDKNKEAYDRKMKIHDKTEGEARKISENYEAAIEERKNLRRLAELMDSGNLDRAARSHIISNPTSGAGIGGALGALGGTLLAATGLGGVFGLPAGASAGAGLGGALGGSAVKEYKRSPESQEFHKIAEIMAMNRIKKIGGGRVTDAILKMARSTVPSLEQSQKGRERVINNLLKENEEDILRYKAMNDVVGKDGFRSINFTRDVNAETKKRMKNFNKKIKKNPLFVSKAKYKPGTTAIGEALEELSPIARQEDPEAYARYIKKNKSKSSFGDFLGLLG